VTYYVSSSSEYYQAPAQPLNFLDGLSLRPPSQTNAYLLLWFDFDYSVSN